MANMVKRQNYPGRLWTKRDTLMNNSSYWPDFNDLWDYSNPAGTEEKFNKILAEDTDPENATHNLQLQTQIA